jgi:hypothetical protein
MPWCTRIIIPRSADTRMYLCHNYSQYRCLGALASSFPASADATECSSHYSSQYRCLGVLASSYLLSADARMYSRHNSWQYRCLGVLASSFHGVQMPRMYLSHLLLAVQMSSCTCTIVPRSVDASVYLYHHSQGCRCRSVLASSFPGVWMPQSTRAIIPQSTNAELYSTVYLHYHSPECRCHRVLAPSFLKVQMPCCTV